MPKVTKKDLERLCDEVFAWAEANDCGKDFGVFYNGKRQSWRFSFEDCEYHKVTEEDINPMDYCEYFSPNFVMGMWYDGTTYDIMNDCGKEFDKLNDLLAKYGLYCEHCDSIHAEFVPIDNIEDFEYTEFQKENPVWIYQPIDAPDYAIQNIMTRYFELAEAVGDIGACTVGQYIEFRYKGTLYRMYPQTPYQGDYSWTQPIPEVKQMLENVGAKDIYVNYGRLD